MVFLDQDSTTALRSTCLASDNAGKPLSLAVISLDDLGAFRRKYGYDLGDQVLSHVENVAREVLNPPELYRTTDDGYVTAIPDAEEAVFTALERLRSRIEGSKLRFTVDGSSVAHSMTISAGVVGRKSPISPEILLARCSEAWHIARNEQNTVSIYTGRDPVTGLPSGPAVLDQLRNALEKAATRNVPLSIVQIDIDQFRAANEAFGPEVCDGTLRTLADQLTNAFGSDAVVGRLWADEFLIILDETRSEDAAFSAEAARRSIEAIAAPGGTISLSIGVAAFPLHSGDPGGLLRKAREARYQAKQDGGARTRVAEADQMVTKTSHFSKIQLKRLAALARSQERSEAAILREGLDTVLAAYEDSAADPYFPNAG